MTAKVYWNAYTIMYDHVVMCDVGDSFAPAVAFAGADLDIQAASEERQQVYIIIYGHI